MKLIASEKIDVVLELITSEFFTTEKFIKIFSTTHQSTYKQIVDEYGEGGKGSGKHYSAKVHIAKSLSNYKGTKPLEFVKYIASPPEWGSEVIALWHIDILSNSIESDLLEAISQSEIGDTEKIQSILARIGQGKFRKDLIKRWGACHVTRCTMVNILVASHIKPWSKSEPHERLDVYNGLLLIPNIDKLFDKGYITFSPKGHIIISNDIEAETLELLGINSNTSIAIPEECEKYMAFHREFVFKDTSN